MDSVVITTGSPSANTSNEPNINATRLRGTLVLVLSQAICLASAGMVVVICTGLRYVPKKDKYTKDNTDEENLSCIRGITSGLVMLIILGLFGFLMFVIQFISKIKNGNPCFDRLRLFYSDEVLLAFMASILCIVFGAITKHEQGCVQFLQDENPNFIFYMNFMIVYGTTTTIVDAVFIWLNVQESWRQHQENKEKISVEQKRKPHEKAREKQARKAASKGQEQKESDEKEVQRRMAGETLVRRESEVSTRRQQAHERQTHKKEMHLLDQNLVVAKRIETAVDDAVVSTTIKVSEIQETEGGSKSDAQCVICLNADPSHVFFPCGHMCVCESCAEIFKRRQDPCPLCRGPQNALTKVFK
jgi:hypothetical protein